MTRYTLIGADRVAYQSEQPGAIGGHRAACIYGRLDLTPRRCVPLTAVVTQGIACSSPTRPPPSRPATGRAPGACPDRYRAWKKRANADAE